MQEVTSHHVWAVVCWVYSYINSFLEFGRGPSQATQVQDHSRVYYIVLATLWDCLMTVMAEKISILVNSRSKFSRDLLYVSLLSYQCRGINVKSCYCDFDWHHRGYVTETQVQNWSGSQLASIIAIQVEGILLKWLCNIFCLAVPSEFPRPPRDHHS